MAQQFLYRYISFEQLVSLVQKQALTFVLPSRWEDPEEKNKLYEDSSRLPDFYEKFMVLLFCLKSYAQSWTSLAESDAMWRIYSYGQRSLRIRTSIEKINMLNSVQMRPVVYSDTCADMGEKSLENALNILSRKRTAFSHEQEYRLIKTIVPSSQDELINEAKTLFLAACVNKDIEFSRKIYKKIWETDLDGDLEKLKPYIKNRREPSSVDVPFSHIKNFIEGVMVNPFAPDWYVDTVKEYCNRADIYFDGKSMLYSDRNTEH